MVVGNACASLPLVLAGLVGARGANIWQSPLTVTFYSQDTRALTFENFCQAVRVFDAHARALEHTLTQNPQAASVVTVQRTCLSVPVNLSSDRVWGRAPACLQGYVGNM